MSDTVIKVENLGKKYILSHLADKREQLFSSLLVNKAKSFFNGGKKVLSSPLSLHSPSTSSTEEEFWALNDVSFEIKQGDRVGIIGRNGAGKSTLLKILSRITEPTKGRITIDGRVASLLEVGTGFHSELSGRENIYLNGAILGMSRVEIKRKFDEIVDFAEVERFLDTPVKRYSSGMYVRLAFAVAAHLEPEILIVDEVLAVGDAEFQKKCLGKMEDVSNKEGRTVLFVSHNMGAIERLCDRAVMLENGRTKFAGETRTAIQMYSGNLQESMNSSDISSLSRTGSGAVILTSFSLENGEGNNVISTSSGETVVLVFGYKCPEQTVKRNVSLGFSLHNSVGDVLSLFYSDYAGSTFEISNYEGQIRCKIENFPFSLGQYFVGTRIVINGIEADWPRGYVGSINVESGDFYKHGTFGNAGLGPLLLSGDWDSR